MNHLQIARVRRRRLHGVGARAEGDPDPRRLLDEHGTFFTEGHIRRIGAAHGVEYSHIDARSSVDI